MDKLTQKIRKKLALLMAGVLFFNSASMLNLLVYAQGDGITIVSDGDVSDGDVSDGDVSDGDVSDGDVSDGDVSGGDVSDGDVSGGDSDNTPPGFKEVEYLGWSRIEDGQGNVVEDVSNNEITESMHVFAKGEVTLNYLITEENAEDIPYVKVFDVYNKNEKEVPNIEWENSGDSSEEWCATIPVSGQGRHVVILKYCKGDSEPQEIASSAAIYIDSNVATLKKVKYSARSKDPVEIEGGMLEEDSVTRYYNENVKVEFELAELFFCEKDLSLSDSYYEDSNNTLQYCATHKNGMVHVVCEIPKKEEGTHELSMNYYDKIYDCNVSYKTTIIMDTTPASFEITHTKWESAWLENAEDGDKEIFQDSYDKPNTLYYKESMELNFKITEKNFRAEDVIFSDDFEKDAVLTWIPDAGEENVWKATYSISDMGEHKVRLSYQDRSGNEPPIEYVSERIILDETAPSLSGVDFTPWEQAVESDTLVTLPDYELCQRQDVNLYYKDKVDMTFIIEEENFHEADVVFLDQYNGKINNKVLRWNLVETGNSENNNLWTATYTIPKEEAGKHVVTLEYKDRSGNELIKYTSETIIIDAQEPQISISGAQHQSAKTEDGTAVLYYRGGQKAKVCIKEDNFRASDVNATVSGGDAVTGIDANEITAELKNPSSWTKEPEGYVAYIELNNAGKYNFVINYTDLAMNEAAETSVMIIVDGEAPKVGNLDVAAAYDTDLCKRMVDKDNETVTTADADTRFIYQGPMTFKLVIEEENFGAEFTYVSVYRDGIRLENNDGYQYKWDTEAANPHNHTLSLKLGEKDEQVVDGDYQVIVGCKDIVGNPMSPYTSNIITIDKTNPEIAVTYNNNDAKNETYYDEERVAAITVTDRNVVPGEIEVNVTAKDIEGNVLDYDLDVRQSPWNPGEEQNTWISTITYDIDANYEFEIKCKDMATNNSYASDGFTVDKTAPDKANFRIEYSTPIMEAEEGTLQNSFYKDGVTVKITAEEITSPIECFEWTYMMQPGASSINQESETNVIDNTNAEFTYDETKRVATAEFTLTADQAKQYRGSLRFKATNMAGKTSEEFTDAERTVIVDSISPTRTVEYSPASQIINKDTLDTLTEFDYASENAGAALIYNAPMTISFKINEANFYANDVVVKINDTVTSITDWSKSGDVWTGRLNINEDGEYVVTLQYEDRSTNKMVDYVSHTIIIDTIPPQIHVNYDSNDIKQVLDGVTYYDKQVTAVITIVEHNFRAEDVEAIVKATDINGNHIEVADFAAHLKNPDNWVTQGNTHTAHIVFEKDANYEFDIAFKDLALTPADDYPKAVFTVDQTAPTNVTVSYSSPVSERTILGVEYEFYKDPIVVTVTAEDEISGVYSFDCSYIRAAGVSSVNSEDIINKVEDQNITYSEDRKTATATFVIPASELRSGTQLNGNMQFAVNNRSMLTTEYKDSRRYVVDNIEPNVTVEFNGPERQTNDISYYAENINITITVDEANFYKEDVKVSISKDGGEQYAAEASWRTVSVDRYIGSITLEEEGNYNIYVSYQDPSTNKMEDYQSNLLVIDKTGPSVSVSGIKNNSANKQEQIGFVVTVEDTNLNVASFRPKLTAEIRDESRNIRQVDCTELGTIEPVTVGKSYTYTIPNISQDGIYQLTCLASDMSGNVTENMIIRDSNEQTMTQLNYSVNRNGSTYSLGEGTQKLINTFVKKAIDVVVYETNPDEISNIRITLFKNDETIILEEGKDYTVNRISDDGDWYKYEYIIYAANFMDDGTYRISIYSEDKAGNIAENNLDVKNVEINFGVDKTLPNLIVTNLESKTTYPVDKLSVLMRATDNMKLQSITVELDGKAIASWDEEQIQQMSNNFEDFVFDILGNETKAHNLIITLTDIAGNQRIETISDFYVTRNLWIRFTNNKILFYGSVIACLSIGSVPVLLGKRRIRRLFSWGV